MDSDLAQAILYFALSYIPYLCAFATENPLLKFGFFLEDAALSIASLVFLAFAIGWWTIPVFIGLLGLGFISSSYFGNPYDGMTTHD